MLSKKQLEKELEEKNKQILHYENKLKGNFYSVMVYLNNRN